VSRKKPTRKKNPIGVNRLPSDITLSICLEDYRKSREIHEGEEQPRKKGRRKRKNRVKTKKAIIGMVRPHSFFHCEREEGRTTWRGGRKGIWGTSKIRLLPGRIPLDDGIRYSHESPRGIGDRNRELTDLSH